MAAAPTELHCRGGDSRGLKGFIAAALAGRLSDVSLAPMTREASAGAHRGAHVRCGALTDPNAVARFLGGAAILPPLASAPAERWACERWTEWEAVVLSPAVALACATRDAAQLAASHLATLEARLGDVADARGSSSGEDASAPYDVFLAGGDAPTLADVVVFAALFPIMATEKEEAAAMLEQRAEKDAPGDGLERDRDVVAAAPMVDEHSASGSSLPRLVAWREALASDERTKKALALGRASVSASRASCAADGLAAMLAVEANAVPSDPSAETFSITTAINYANGAPHMGHAYEAVGSDVLARYHRAYGRRVLFQTGSDEHGQKIAEAAEAAGVRPIELCDRYVAAFQTLNAKIAVSNDVYNRTTSDAHKTACRELFERSRRAGDIYLDTYEGWYNVREETFVTESDAQRDEYKDPVSGKPLKKMSEASYFFRQSAYQARLVDHIEKNPGFIQPAARRNEILARLREDELRDLSVSRTTFDWGIPVPDAPEHVLYVWFDALTNYLTGAGWPASGDAGGGFWPADVHVIGKDIIWFHCVIWPCMLWSAGLPLPATVFGHGFVTAADGQKMSKSIGNVVDPLDVLQKYSSDSFRYYLTRTAAYGSDVPFSEQNLVLIHNADLADVIGNLVHRATNLCAKNCGGVVPAAEPETTAASLRVGALRAQTERAMRRFEIQRACELAINAVKDTNKYLTDAAPWAVKGEGAEERKAVIIRTTLECVFVAAHFLAPFVPDAAAAIFSKLGTPPRPIWRLDAAGKNLAPGTPVAVGDILFAKHESQAASGAEEGGKGGGGDAKGASSSSAAAPVAKKKAPASDAPVNVSRLDVRVGTIVEVRRHPDAEKLYVEMIDLGEPAGPRQVVSGLVDHVPEAEMLGRRVVVVANMKPSKMRGVESRAMVLCGTGADGKVEPVGVPSDVGVVEDGARVVFDGYAGEPDETLNPKKKVFEAVAAGFEIAGDGTATYRGEGGIAKFGVRGTEGEGVCALPTLREGTIK